MIIHTAQESNGILHFTVDAPNSRVNVIDEKFIEELDESIQRLETDTTVVGAVFSSAKREFIVGADLNQVYAITTPEAAMEFAGRYKTLLRRIERCNKPVVAALNGTALGGGYELAMACHCRIAIHDKAVLIGLPEVKFGLLPGAGGTQRLIRMLGITRALPLLLKGTTMSAHEAYEHGLIDALASDHRSLVEKSVAWALACKDPVQPWDKRGWSMPNGTPRDPVVAQQLASTLAGAEATTFGIYPVIVDILSCVYEGSLVDIDNALDIESRYFARAATSPSSRNMLHTLWFQHNAVKRSPLPFDVTPMPVKKLAVMGASTLTSGIASVASKAGIEVVLFDPVLRTADNCKSEAKIIDLRGCELVVDATAESARSKDESLDNRPSISLRHWLNDIPHFIELHLSWPALDSSMLEIVRTSQTSSQAIAYALGLARQIGRTPIVVNGRSFAKTLAIRYMSEGLRLLFEGERHSRIEMSALKAGMKVGPLTLLNEIGMDTFVSMAAASRADFLQVHVEDIHGFLKPMVALEGASGLKGPPHPEIHTRSKEKLDEAEIVDRLLFVQALEAVHALKTGRIRTAADVNVASVLAAGFCPQHGGALQFVKAFGLDAFIARANGLARKHGERFVPEPSLRDMVEKGVLFSD